MDHRISQFLRTIFGVSDDDDFARISREFQEVLEDYIDLTREVFGPNVDTRIIALLAVFCGRNELRPDVPWLVDGQKCWSKVHNDECVYLRPGPCGRARIVVRGRAFFVSPLDLLPDKPPAPCGPADDAQEADSTPEPPAVEKRSIRRPRKQSPVGAGA